MKNITRKNKKITRETIIKFVETLNLPNRIKKEINDISVYNYTGKYV